MEQINVKAYRREEQSSKKDPSIIIFFCLSSGDHSGKHGVAFIITRDINNIIDVFKPIHKIIMYA